MIAVRRWICLLAVVCVVGTPVMAKDEWTVKSVLKQIDKSTKGARWVTADVRWNEYFTKAINTDGNGKAWVDLGGRMRAEVKGSNPRTLLLSPAYAQLYKPLEQVTEVYNTFEQPELLVQYAIVGFVPRGSALKQSYKVALVKQEEVDGRNSFLLQLTPKSADAAEAVPVLMVWIDQATWLPAQQMIRQGEGGLQISINYDNVTVQPELPSEMFQSNWPDGTTIVRE